MARPWRSRWSHIATAERRRSRSSRSCACSRAIVAPFAATLADRHRRDHMLRRRGLRARRDARRRRGPARSRRPRAPVYASIAGGDTEADAVSPRPLGPAVGPVLAGPLGAAALIAVDGAEATLATCALASLASALLLIRLHYAQPRGTRPISGDGGTWSRPASARRRSALPLIAGLTCIRISMAWAGVVEQVHVSHEADGAGVALELARRARRPPRPRRRGSRRRTSHHRRDRTARRPEMSGEPEGRPRNPGRASVGVRCALADGVFSRPSVARAVLWALGSSRYG
jgi:hypothetical protein